MSDMNLIPASQIRGAFARAMSQMYRQEVPQYGELLDMVQQINAQELAANPQLSEALDASDTLQRLSAERHGAIRVGSARELSILRRLFAVMGMYPVAYYDLTEAAIPVHSTAFRPLALEELNANPFRIFTSLLRLDLIEDPDLRQRAQQLLDNREIFPDSVLQLIECHEQQKGLSQRQAERFVDAALDIFRWHQQASVDKASYQRFLNTHRLVADIVCFRGPHINHLTPRTLNIDRVQQQMSAQQMHPKAIIEGPPQRQQPILLRQTSFKALDEPVLFVDEQGRQQAGSHTARFGEIEQRGMALTPKGRGLYDRLLMQVRDQVPDAISNVDEYYRQLQQCFTRFPDDLTGIWQQGLGYFRYRAVSGPSQALRADWQWLIDNAHVRLIPITYEDFLPVSAAGIFQSNLDQRETQQIVRSPNQQAFEQALGCEVVSEFEFYAQIQADSITQCLQQLGFDRDVAGQLMLQLEEMTD